jgi:hypothetical protein
VLHHSAKCNYAKCHCAKQNHLNGTNVLSKKKICATKMNPVKHDTPASHISLLSVIMINVVLPSKHTSMKKVFIGKIYFSSSKQNHKPFMSIHSADFNSANCYTCKQKYLHVKKVLLQ